MAAATGIEFDGIARGYAHPLVACEPLRAVVHVQRRVYSFARVSFEGIADPPVTPIAAEQLAQSKLVLWLALPRCPGFPSRGRTLAVQLEASLERQLVERVDGPDVCVDTLLYCCKLSTAAILLLLAMRSDPHLFCCEVALTLPRISGRGVDGRVRACRRDRAGRRSSTA